ncbi:MAG TPA: DUF1648 domain-containing protein [Pyrinomonadaceae bacterium]|nr:DUF1648 domain-containing protein [Pyrinomonadaceae bacterium]
MKDFQIIVWTLLLSEVVLLAVFMWLPVMGGERAFFGVRVEPQVFHGEGRLTLRRYRLTLVASFGLIVALGFYVAAWFGQPALAVAATLASTAAAFLIYGAYARTVRPLAVESTVTRFASGLRVRRLADYTHLWLEAAILLLVGATFALLIQYYPQLPERMPVHWNASGEADGWARKSLATVFFLPALGVYLHIFFLVLKHDIAHAKMTLPDAHAEEFLRGKEQYLSANMRLIDWARASVALLFFNIVLLMLVTTIDEFGRYLRAVNIASWIIVAGMLAGIFYFIWRMKRINNELRAATGEWYVQRPGDEKHWRHGGLTYYNPDDPSLVVEKLVGYGYTLNMAHPGIWARALLLGGVPLFVVWAVLNM